MKIISTILSAVIIYISISGCKTEQLTLSIYDKNQVHITSLSDRSEYITPKSGAYIDIVINEATEIIADIEHCDEKQAKRLLFNSEYCIYTYFDEDINNAISETYKTISQDLNMGCAVTNLNGNLIAAYSGLYNSNEFINYALHKTPPYSSFKPLAVYAPAIERKIINWSSLFEDSPYKKIQDSSGSLMDWPSNYTDTYSNKEVTPYTAIKESLNTVAVKCLSKLGVNNSIDFLIEKLSVNLEFEQYKSTIYGQEEVIGNIALGYLQYGVSPIDMAGYYQIFANGGNYIKPQTVLKICDSSGKAVYSRDVQGSQVISSDTSCIMNKLLQGVVTPGGTGAKAYCGDIPVAGKTGTGDENKGNWFVGVTPEYSCAVWHSNTGQGNFAAKMFSEIITNIKSNNKSFMTAENVKQKIYCLDSGMLLSDKCKKFELGYYADGNIPDICNKH